MFEVPGEHQGMQRTSLIVAGLSLVLGTAGGNLRAATPEGEWIAGDLHVHSIWSKDVCETPQFKNTRDASNPTKPCDDPSTWGWAPEEQLARAQDRGLGFIALTDHNTNKHLTDPAVTGYTGATIAVPGVEFTLSGGEGHANLLGWTHGKPADPTPGDGHYTAADIQAIVDTAHAEGSLVSINHPLNPSWGLGYPDVDSVEVWNYPWSSMVLPVIGSENTRAITWWEQHYLETGQRVAAVGGSDNHWRSTGEIQGVGQPTTWVFATDRSVDGILDAIRSGRTSVSAEPPGKGGARLRFEADADGDGTFESMIGDEIPAGMRAFRARVEGGAGMILRIVSEAGIVYETLVDAGDDTLAFSAPVGDWIRAELFVPDASSERRGACAALGVDQTMDEVNEMLVGIGETVIEGASETRPINMGPCVVAQMEAMTSPIYAID